MIFLTLSRLAASADKYLQTVWTQIRTDKTSVLIWGQTIWHSDKVPEITFDNVNFEEKRSADGSKNKKNIQHAKS